MDDWGNFGIQARGPPPVSGPQLTGYAAYRARMGMGGPQPAGPPMMMAPQPVMRPPQWVEARAPDGRPYWYHESTQQTPWDCPFQAPPVAAPPPPVRWVEAHAPDGRPYWYNADTRETTWENPNAGNETTAKTDAPPTQSYQKPDYPPPGGGGQPPPAYGGC
eukprot:TRINITY_DN13673_c0_g1_i2.p2 TRINITY_DN13673_c0_g1~~TRINITY_DN13673_c0_g1_i2.p2  ORF type:complete len:162 (+),score=3.24 TRINITY_DN13673_c0_g1_i2:138-623(+)